MVVCGVGRGGKKGGERAGQWFGGEGGGGGEGDGECRLPIGRLNDPERTRAANLQAEPTASRAESPASRAEPTASRESRAPNIASGLLADPPSSRDSAGGRGLSGPLSEPAKPPSPRRALRQNLRARRAFELGASPSRAPSHSRSLGPLGLRTRRFSRSAAPSAGQKYPPQGPRVGPARRRVPKARRRGPRSYRRGSVPDAERPTGRPARRLELTDRAGSPSSAQGPRTPARHQPAPSASETSTARTS